MGKKRITDSDLERIVCFELDQMELDEKVQKIVKNLKQNSSCKAMDYKVEKAVLGYVQRIQFK